MWEIIFGMAFAYILVCFVFVPVYISLGITSIYQYLDLRFNSHLVRCLASATYIIRQLLLLSITVYTPSVALKTILGIPQWASIVVLTSVGIFFTLLVRNLNRIEANFLINLLFRVDFKPLFTLTLYKF